MKNSPIKNIAISALSGGVTAALLVFALFPQSQVQQYQENGESSISEYLQDLEYVSEQDMVVSVVEKASPAVVSIIITKDVPVLEQYYEEFGSPFDDFFGGPSFNFSIPKYRDSGETEEKEVGGGSGFLVSSDGLIITNKHVVDEEGASYTVFTSEGEEYEAEIVDKDSLNDIAVLKIQTENAPYLEFANSDELKPGQTTIAIGNPLLEFNNSVSVGVVSGLSRNITAGSRFFGKTEYLEGVIQTDAAINPGNSGGPLLNLNGKAVGVNVAIANAENIGFSIPSNVVKTVVDSVSEHGKIMRPFLGVRYVEITESLKENNNLTVDYGVLVTRGETVEDLAVIPGSPADKADIQENDIILEVDGQKLDGDLSLAKIIAAKNIGDKVELLILRKGEEQKVNVILEEPERKSTDDKKS